MVQPSAAAVRSPRSTAFRLRTGSDPGRPRQTGQISVLGGAPNVTGQAQNIFDAVKSCTWISKPMTTSNCIASVCVFMSDLTPRHCEPGGRSNLALTGDCFVAPLLAMTESESALLFPCSRLPEFPRWSLPRPCASALLCFAFPRSRAPPRVRVGDPAFPFFNNRWPPRVPLRRLLVGVRRAQHRGFVEGFPNQLQPDGQAAGEPARHRDAGQARQIH